MFVYGQTGYMTGFEWTWQGVKGFLFLWNASTRTRLVNGRVWINVRSAPSTGKAITFTSLAYYNHQQKGVRKIFYH